MYCTVLKKVPFLLNFQCNRDVETTKMLIFKTNSMYFWVSECNVMLCVKINCHLLKSGKESLISNLNWGPYRTSQMYTLGEANHISAYRQLKNGYPTKLRKKFIQNSETFGKIPKKAQYLYKLVYLQSPRWPEFVWPYLKPWFNAQFSQSVSQIQIVICFQYMFV